MARSYLPEAHTIYGYALQAARRSGDLAAEARALNGLGGIAMMKGRFGHAAGHFQAALERYGQCGDSEGEARVLHNLGVRASAAQRPVCGRLLPPSDHRP
jgi:uncharacterized protein HemY